MENDIETNLLNSISYLEEIRATIDRIDPKNQMLSGRVQAAYKVYKAIDDECKRMKTIDHKEFVAQLSQIACHLEKLSSNTSATIEKEKECLIGKCNDEITQELYGRAWSVFDERAFVSAAALLEKRFSVNDLGLDFVKNADCLDFGCGTGRYCYAMLKIGAKSVHGVDFSNENIQLAKERTQTLLSNSSVRFQTGDITKVFEQVYDAYDFVIAQGVIHHLKEPLRIMRNLYQILRPGGKLYLFVYGDTGLGIYWKVVDLVRYLLKPVSIEKAHYYLEVLGASKNNIYTILDVGYVPVQWRLKRMILENMLLKCGFEIVKSMTRGEIYETNERIHRFPQEKVFWGNEELRYLVMKPEQSNQETRY